MAHGPRAVPFDQDGTLVDTFIPARHAHSVAAGRNEARGETVADTVRHPGIVSLLTSQKEEGLTTGVATSSAARSAQLALGSPPLTDLVDGWADQPADILRLATAD